MAQPAITGCSAFAEHDRRGRAQSRSRRRPQQRNSLPAEQVVRLRDLGHVNRVLTGLRLEGTEPAPPGAKLWHDGKEVGQVTSSVLSPARTSSTALSHI